MVSTCFNSLWISYDFKWFVSVSHPLRGWGCAFHPLCWSSHPRKSSAALRSPSSPNHHRTCVAMDAGWTNGCMMIFYNIYMSAIWCCCVENMFFSIAKSLEACSLFWIFNGFSLDFRCSIPKRLLPVDSPPFFATECPRMPQDAAPGDLMTGWSAG